MSNKLPKDVLKKAYSLMCTARAMSDIYEKNKEVTSKYVHATSKGHEAIQLAVDLNDQIKAIPTNAGLKNGKRYSPD